MSDDDRGWVDTVGGLALMLAFTALVLWSGGAFGAEIITGPVRVIDGDTMQVGRQKVRLCGIDTPERGEPGWKAAGDHLRSLTAGKTARCVVVGSGTPCDGLSKRRSHDRLVAQCTIEGRDVAEAMVRARHACDWTRFSGGHYRVVGGCSR